MTSEARVARDQRLKLGHLAFLAKCFPTSIPFLLHSIPHLPKPDRRLSCVSCCGGALHPGQLKESWTLSLSGPCPAPSYRDDLKREKIKEDRTIPRNVASLSPSILGARHPPSLLRGSHAHNFGLLSGHLNKGLKSPLQAVFRSCVKILHSLANATFSFSSRTNTLPKYATFFGGKRDCPVISTHFLRPVEINLYVLKVIQKIE